MLGRDRPARRRTKERMRPVPQPDGLVQWRACDSIPNASRWLTLFYAERSSRPPLYQNSSFSRERAARGPRRMIDKDRPRTYRAEYIRNFRPEVRVGARNTLKRPSFLRARLK